MPYIRDYVYTKVNGWWYAHLPGDKPWLDRREPRFETKKQAQAMIRSKIDRTCWPGR